MLDRIYGKATQKDVVEISAIKGETLSLLESVFSGAADAPENEAP